MNTLETSEVLPQLEKNYIKTKTFMPSRLVVIRHGESDANRVNKALKLGTLAHYPAGFENIPDREIRLTEAGCEQAKKNGPWLRQQYPEGFDVIYVSDHTRAKETAALICQSAGWNDVEIRIDALLGERNWGNFVTADQGYRTKILKNRYRDPLHNPMPDGETLLETRHRSRELLDRCARELSGKRVLVISHGEYIEALWAEIAHMNTEKQIDFFSSKAGDIKNCQVVEFSSCNPFSKESKGNLKWVRSSCPQFQEEGTWNEIERDRFTPEQLLDQVMKYPRLDFSELK